MEQVSIHRADEGHTYGARDGFIACAGIAHAVGVTDVAHDGCAAGAVFSAAEALETSRLSRCVALGVAYDGAPFAGFARQAESHVTTVQGELERALSVLYRRAVDDYTTAAARADTRELRLEALTLKALLCVHLSAGDEALAAAEELSHLAPDTPDALKLLGLAHQLLGHRTLARRYLSQAAAKGDANAAELLRKVK